MSVTYNTSIPKLEDKNFRLLILLLMVRVGVQCLDITEFSHDSVKIGQLHGLDLTQRQALLRVLNIIGLLYNSDRYL